MTGWIPALVQGAVGGTATLEVKGGLELEEGKIVFIKVRRARNIRHHRKYWGLLEAVVDATDHWPSPEAMHRWLKWELQMFVPIEVKEGHIVLEWDSTDFAAMDQTAFNEFYDRAIAAIVLETGIDPEALR